MSYDFNNINDYEFELLVADLLAAEFQCHVETYKPGKDKGVDGRFVIKKNDEAIIQCKHWSKSGLSRLLTKIQNEEREKVKKINPTRYIFVTSLPLSLANKKNICEKFSLSCLAETDIYGSDDLNTLLRKHPEVEKAHYKLWICSTAVLHSVLNSGIKSKSKDYLKRVYEKRKLYVPTNNHSKAIQIVNSEKVLIVTGSPGVGKTTLAEQVTLDLVKENYELCIITSNIEDADSIFDPNSKQVFYFDDFLGSNYIEAINDKSDSKVVDFIERVRLYSNKRFILTSRSNIYHSGKQASQYLSATETKHFEYQINIDSLSQLEKAKILYNHIWYSKLDEAYTLKFYVGEKYKEVIQHSNFNPRLIAFITAKERVKNYDADNYIDFVDESLTNPEMIWEHVLENQIDKLACKLCIAVSLNGGHIPERKFIDTYYQLRGDVSTPFDNYIRRYSGSIFLRNISFFNVVTYRHFDPSLNDYIIHNYFKDPASLLEYFKLLGTYNCIKTLKSLYNDKYINKSVYNFILRELIVYVDEQFDELNDFTIYLFYTYIASDDNQKLDLVDIYLLNAFEKGLMDISSMCFFNCIECIEYLKDKDVIDNYLEVKNSFIPLINTIHSIDYFVHISTLISEIDDEEIDEKFHERADEILCQDITDIVYHEGFCDHVFSEDDYDQSKVSFDLEFFLRGIGIDDTKVSIDSALSFLDLESIIIYNNPSDSDEDDVLDSPETNSCSDELTEEEEIERIFSG
ncbi:restriction endonuclease [Kangiella sp.]|uniref:nSTAND3 domain-containing NTPase n=1 Tax=Kangiella sp. TaxID=1920245 RepID=UPI003A95DD3A